MTPEQAVELLPCPFCGTLPKVRHGADAGTHRILRESDDCLGPYTAAVPLEDATMQWNTRAAAPLLGTVGRETVESNLLTELKNLVECLDLARRNNDVSLPFAGYGEVHIDKARAAIANAEAIRPALPAPGEKE